MNRRKILNTAELLAWRESARSAGETVVHCHGCFDVVHPGHIHHLRHARSLGDRLVVSVSSDANVNKGVNRPLIPDDLRCDSLAALECVDAVYLNPRPTAVELLGSLRPDVFVKGREYEISGDPRFLAERDAVTAAGGRVVFSSGDVVYSSTALIGALRDTSAFAEEKVARYRRQHDLSGDTIANLLQRGRGKRVVVVGDYILDRYEFCEPTGVAGEGPMMALRSLGRREYDGGAAIIARHLAAMGASPTLLIGLPDDDAGAAIEARLRDEGVAVEASRHCRHVVTKTRFVADDAKLFKIDEGGGTPLDSESERVLAGRLLRAAANADAVIFADFGYGLITPGLLDGVLPPLRGLVPVLSADVSGGRQNLLRFNGVDLLCPTERELRDTLRDPAGGLGALVSELLRTTDARGALVTLGKHGLIACDWAAGNWLSSDGRLRSEYLPALAPRGVDTLGCGDALLAAATLALTAGATLQQAGFIGSLAAAVEVGHVGNVPVTADALLDALLVGADAKPAARLAG